MKGIFSRAICFAFIVGCGQPAYHSNLFLVPLTKEEARQDFEQMVSAIKGLYGPLEYKTEHDLVKLDFEGAQAEALNELEAASSDAEVASVFNKFLRKFRDGHVGISFPLSDQHIANYSIPLFIMPVMDKDDQWRAIVVDVGEELKDSAIKVGDEILKVDGLPVFELLEAIKKYKSFSNDISDRHLLYKVFSRDFFMTDLVPASPTAMVEFKSAAEEDVSFENLVWKQSKDSTAWVELVKAPGRTLTVTNADDMNRVIEGPLKKMGDSRPFFATSEVEKEFNLIEVEPTTQALKKFGLEKKDAAPIYAATYVFEDKKVLLVRQPGYEPPIENSTRVEEEKAYYEAIKVWIQTYKAIMWQNADADVLVIDQTHNPGGISTFAFDFFRLFITKTQKSLIQLNNVDRKWILNYKDEADRMTSANRPAEADRNRAWAKKVEEAGERGETLTDPVTFDYDFWLQPHEDFTWKKPMLVLADELAGSCGDIFPMLMKHNNIAPIFGERTMGLGGNVESITLSNSQAKFRLTRGLFTTYQGQVRADYDQARFVENNGIQPDTHYQHRVEGVRQGYTDYVRAFTKRALEEIK